MGDGDIDQTAQGDQDNGTEDRGSGGIGHENVTKREHPDRDTHETKDAD